MRTARRPGRRGGPRSVRLISAESLRSSSRKPSESPIASLERRVRWQGGDDVWNPSDGGIGRALADSPPARPGGARAGLQPSGGRNRPCAESLRIGAPRQNPAPPRRFGVRRSRLTASDRSAWKAFSPPRRRDPKRGSRDGTGTRRRTRRGRGGPPGPPRQAGMGVASTLSTRRPSMSTTSKRQPWVSKWSPADGMRPSWKMTKPARVAKSSVSGRSTKARRSKA